MIRSGSLVASGCVCAPVVGISAAAWATDSGAGDRQGADEWWQDGDDGKQNMIYCSHRVINGSGNITKNSTPNW